ncbi:MAG: ACP phosphodiesterase [Mucilaginibacter sp.]
MNFLSHYYFDRGTTNHYHTLGTVLPDLLKNADKTINLHPEKLHHPNPSINDIIIGWQKHLAVDRYFHTSQFFITHSSELRILLTPAVAGSPVKTFFLGHIALELILDNLLITTDKVSPDEFYDHLSTCNNDVIEEFLNFSGLAETDQFFRFYENFKRSRYLETYAETQQLAYALRRICMRIWNDPFTPEHEGKMNAVLSAYRDELLGSFMAIFDLIEYKLKAKN